MGSGPELVFRVVSWSCAPGVCRSGGASENSAMGSAAQAAERAGPGLRGPAEVQQCKSPPFPDHTSLVTASPSLSDTTCAPGVAQVSSPGVLACPKPPDFWAAQLSETAHRAIMKVTALVPRSYGGWQDDKL